MAIPGTANKGVTDLSNAGITIREAGEAMAAFGESMQTVSVSMRDMFGTAFDFERSSKIRIREPRQEPGQSAPGPRINPNAVASVKVKTNKANTSSVPLDPRKRRLRVRKGDE